MDMLREILFSEINSNKNKNEQICGIYKITSPVGKIYIGQSINCIHRFYKYSRINSCKSQQRLYRSLKKYGWENHKFEIICTSSKSELNDLEKKYIIMYNSFNTLSGLNLREGGNCESPSEETRKKLSKANKGKILSEETRKKISESHKGKIISKEHRKAISKFHKGRKKPPRTEEWKQKISKSKKGKKPNISEESRQKMRQKKFGNPFKKGQVAWNLGIPRSCETKMKISNSNLGRLSPNKGKHLSDETKEKIRQANLGKKYSIETNAKKGRKGGNSGSFKKGKVASKLEREESSKRWSGSGNPNYGNKLMTPEHKQKLIKANLNKVLSKETILKMRLSRLGKRHSPESIVKMKEIQALYRQERRMMIF